MCVRYISVDRFRASVLIGRTTRLVRLSVRPSVRPSDRLSVLYGLLPQKRRGTKKPKLALSFSRSGITGVPIVSSKGQKSGGRPHNMSALGQRTFDCLQQKTPDRANIMLGGVDHQALRRVLRRAADV